MPQKPTAEGTQEEMELSYTYPVEEMGHVISQATPHMVRLNDHFLTEKLGASSFDTMPGWESKRKTPKVGCPFCKEAGREGFLKLESVEAAFSSGPDPLGSKHHVGNHYAYNCSNGECDARFVGTDQWMWIG